MRVSLERLKEYSFDYEAVERAVNNVMARSNVNKMLNKSVFFNESIRIDRHYIRNQMIEGFKMYLTLVIKK